jgi:hypothetical protein
VECGFLLIIGKQRFKMSLHDVVHQLASAMGTANLTDATIGFGTPRGEQLTLRGHPNGYTLEEGVRHANVIIQGTADVFQRLAALLSEDDPDLAAVQKAVDALTIIPGAYAMVLAHILHHGRGIEIDITNFRKGWIPKPLRYPVPENVFLARRTDPAPIPACDLDALPELVADDHPAWVEMYRKAWKIGFGNLRQPEPESGFVSNFIDTAFNDNSFMWDSCFMTMFGHYGRRVFPFIGTLDNFYAKQHADGFICREINTYDGRDLFTPQDPSSTGPPIVGWTEWIHYERAQDIDRLRAIFPTLVAYHLWWRDWRTYPDGSYFTDGWGSGMDNQTRVPDSTHYHRHYRWVDANMQQALNCRILQQMGTIIDRTEFHADLQAEYERLKEYINTHLWDEKTGFYYDLAPDGSFSSVKGIGAYWGLLTGVVPEDRAARMLAHLEDPALFNRPHRVPSQAADSLGYQDDGAYWRGGVWAPTNYMVLRALTYLDQDDLAHAIGRNHLENVAQVFTDTGTLWENYAPEYAGKGNPAKGNFVGWTGISAISVPFEYVIGLRPDESANRLLWDIRLIERHGALRYPLGAKGTLDLICAARETESTPPALSVTTDVALTLEARWSGGNQSWDLDPGEHNL